MLLLLAVCAAATGGPESPVLPFLVLVPAMATLRFRLAVSYALSALAAVLIVLVGFAVDPQAAVDNPVPMIAALVMIANIVGVCTALMQGELEHRDRAVLDPLTGLLNRAALGSRVAEIEQQARVTGGPVALVLLDLDHFKRVNDEYGHERGDAVLRDAAYEIRKSLRSFELVYRFGGEEFLVLLPGADIEWASRSPSASAARSPRAGPGDLDLTLSAGVAAAAGDGVSYDDLFRAADIALFEAKRGGRDRVVAAAAPPAALPRRLRALVGRPPGARPLPRHLHRPRGRPRGDHRGDAGRLRRAARGGRRRPASWPSGSGSTRSAPRRC